MLRAAVGNKTGGAGKVSKAGENFTFVYNRLRRCLLLHLLQQKLIG